MAPFASVSVMNCENSADIYLENLLYNYFCVYSLNKA